MRIRITQHSNKMLFWRAATKRVVFSLMTGLLEEYYKIFEGNFAILICCAVENLYIYTAKI